MAKIPRIDLTEFLLLLKSEGKSELRVACTKALGNSGNKILKEWDNIIGGLEEIVPKLAEGVEAKVLEAPIRSIAKSAGALSLMASQVLSFVPGPIGMVCSGINAIVCFCTLPFPANLGNGFLELLGCIPGGKVAGKLAPKVEEILMRSIKKTPGLRDILVGQQSISPKVRNFAKRIEPAVANKVEKTSVKPITPNVGKYNQASVKHFPSLAEAMEYNYKQTRVIKNGKPSFYGANYQSIDYEQFIINMNMGKNNPFSHLPY